MAETPTDVALRYVGQQVETLRASLHDELSAVRNDLTLLSAELRTHAADQGPKIAVLAHRVDKAEKDIATLESAREQERAERERERAADRRVRIQLLWSVGISLLGTLVAVLLAVTQANGG